MWLLDAENQLSAADSVCSNDVDRVKLQFKDHEQFMLSLTESQESVGRVLHRGQV